jgi:hypothetical protein
MINTWGKCCVRTATLMFVVCALGACASHTYTPGLDMFGENHFRIYLQYAVFSSAAGAEAQTAVTGGAGGDDSDASALRDSMRAPFHECSFRAVRH